MSLNIISALLALLVRDHIYVWMDDRDARFPLAHIICLKFFVFELLEKPFQP